MEVGFGAEAAAELDQRSAVIVAMAVEGAVDPALNAAFEGIEDGRSGQNGDDQRPFAYGFRQALVDHQGDERNDAEIASQDEGGGQRVGHAAFEDQVGVHQPVADDGPTEGERQKDQRQAGQIGEQAGRVEVKEERDGVKQREGQHREQSAAGEPLQLLAKHGRVGAPVTAQEEQGDQHVEGGVVGGAGLVEAVLKQPGGLPVVDGQQPQPEQAHAGRVEQRQKPAAADILEPFLREAEREMQEEGGLQRLGNYVRPEDGPVQRVEMAGVLEGIPREGNQAEEIKVGGALSTPAAEENIEADEQVDEADEAQALVQLPVQRLGNHLDRRVQGNAVAGDDVVDLAVGASAVECAFQIVDPRNCLDVLGGAVTDPGQQVSYLDARALARHVGQNSLGFEAASSLAPPYAVVGLLKLALLKKIENSQHEQTGCGQSQQRSLNAVEKASLHIGGVSLIYLFVSTSVATQGIAQPT